MLLQDVAVKVFSKQEYSDDVILSFRQEVSFSLHCISVGFPTSCNNVFVLNLILMLELI